MMTEVNDLIPSLAIAGYMNGLVPYSPLAQSLTLHKVETLPVLFQRAQSFIKIEEVNNNKLDGVEPPSQKNLAMLKKIHTRIQVLSLKPRLVLLDTENSFSSAVMTTKVITHTLSLVTVMTTKAIAHTLGPVTVMKAIAHNPMTVMAIRATVHTRNQVHHASSEELSSVRR